MLILVYICADEYSLAIRTIHDSWEPVCDKIEIAGDKFPIFIRSHERIIEVNITVGD